MTLQGEAVQKTYTRLAPVAEGNSEVFYAHHEVLGEPVVQKVVPLNPAVPDSVFANEPQLLKSLDHPRIPKVYEAQHTPGRTGRITFVMAKVGDRSAADALLAGHRFSVGAIVAIALDLTSALEYLLSTHRLLHRDIKPDNVLLDADRGHAWLIDLQYAGRLGNDRTVRGLATPFPYMAPEVPATGVYSPASEVYSVCTLLYELATRQPLLAGRDPADADARVNRGQRAFPDTAYERWAPHLPDRVRSVIRKGLRKDPSDRHPNVADLRRELLRLRLIDWVEEPAAAGTRVWTGTWPPTRPHADRVPLEVRAEPVVRGVHAGRVRLTARYRPTASPARRFAGLPDRFAAGDDDRTVAAFIRDAEARVAQLRPV